MSSAEIDETEMASILFPKVKYPKMALKRILSGEAVLDADQISRLALFLDTSIDKLFSNWKASYKKGSHKFTMGVYTAELDSATWVTKLFKSDALIHETILSNAAITLSEYIELLNKVVLKFEEDEASKN